MNEPVFTHDAFLSHSVKDKAVVRAVAKRLKDDGLKVWFDEWVLPVAEKIEHGLGQSQLTFQPSAFILQPLLHGSLA